MGKPDQGIPIRRALPLLGYLVSSFFQSGLFWLAGICVARHMGAEKFGEFSYILALVGPLATLSGLQLRNYCVSRREDPVFGQAKFLRLALSTLCFGTLLVATAAVSPKFLFSMAMLVLVKGAEQWSDLCYGWLQAKDRLDRITLLQTLKYGGGSLALAILAFAPSGVPYRHFLVGLAAFLVAFSLLDQALSGFASVKALPGIDRRLLKDTFNLAFAAFLTTFVVNVPRYFLEHYGSLAEVGAFSALFYFYAFPQLAFNYLSIGMLRQMHAALPPHRMALLAVALAVLAGISYPLLQAWGGPLVHAVYGLDVAWAPTYSLTLSLLLFLGGMVSSLYYYLLSAQRYREQTVAGVLSGVAVLAASAWLVPRWHVAGALTAVAVANAASLLVYTVSYLRHNSPPPRSTP